MRIVVRLVSILVLVAYAALPTSAQTYMDLTEGHIDAFHVTAENGLTLDLKEDSSGLGTRHAPEAVRLIIPEAAWQPATEQIIGTPSYFLPQTQDPTLIWPGWDTTLSGVALDLVFGEITGPGQVFVFSTGTFGGAESLLADGSLELQSGSIISLSHPAHVHANWAFTAPGIYTMQVQAVSTTDRSNTATYTWVVGNPAKEDTGDAEVSSIAADDGETAMGFTGTKPAHNGLETATAGGFTEDAVPTAHTLSPDHSNNPTSADTNRSAEHDERAEILQPSSADRSLTSAKNATTAMHAGQSPQTIAAQFAPSLLVFAGGIFTLGIGIIVFTREKRRKTHSSY